jgi:4-aminobutyrate aminotransferase/(S)-3-amino-2-methylpropionate transaminase
MDAVPPGGLGGTFGGNPLACAAAAAVLEAVSDPAFLGAARLLGDSMRARLEAIAAARPWVGDVRGLGPMLALEFEEQSPGTARAVVDAAFDCGLLLLACGLHGNVIRLLPPLTIAADDLAEGLSLLEDALDAAR